MRPRFDGKVALITGGGTGIGAATARRLAAEGARLVLTGRRMAPIEAIAAETGAFPVAGDTANAADVAAAVAAAVKHFGGLDIVVANAGTAIGASVEDTTLDDFRAGLTTNVEGSLLLARQAIPEMRRRGGGSIVLVASLAASIGYPKLAGYLTSKAAILGLNRSIAYDYGVDNIRSNVICPAWIRTDMTDATFAAVAAGKGCTVDELMAKVSAPTPLRRMGTVDEIAAAIAFLASDDASFITGSVLAADGGTALVDASIAVAFADG